jgi:hypothetical protein
VASSPNLPRDLETAVTLARDARATPKQLLHAAEVLTAYADIDASDALIARAQRLLAGSKVESGGFLERLSAVNRTLRGAEIPKRVRAIGPVAADLASDKGLVLVERPGARRLVVVLATMFNDFWVSLPVLHCFLSEHDCAILYLRDHRNRMYLYGVNGFGPDFAALEAAVLDVARAGGYEEVQVLGFSSGGYAGLLLASRIGAQGYLGFSIRSDMSPGSTLPLDRLAMRIGDAPDRQDLLMDLKAVLTESRAPRMSVIYYGEKAVIDAAHAEHLRGAPGVIVKQVKGGLHNSVMSLLAANEFSRVLKLFLG